MYVKGVKVPKLGSLQDRILRDYLSLEAEKEIKKVQLLTILANNFMHEDDKRITKAYTKYLELELGVKIPELDNKEQAMFDYYQKVVKHVKPQISVTGKKGKERLSVSGIEALKN